MNRSERVLGLAGLLVLSSAGGFPIRAQPAPASALAPPFPASQPIDHSLDPPPPPPRHAAKGFLVGGGLLFVGGFLGTVLSPHCATRDAREACVDPQGSAPGFPLMMAAGLVSAVIGSALWRHEVEPAR